MLFVICILDFGCKDVPSFCLMSIHGQSIISLQGALCLDLGKNPATHDFILCCCWWKEPIAAFYFLCLLLFASGFFPSKVWSKTIKSMKQNMLYLCGVLRFDLFLCQVHDSQIAVKHDWSCLSSPGECENWTKKCKANDFLISSLVFASLFVW